MTHQPGTDPHIPVSDESLETFQVKPEPPEPKPEPAEPPPAKLEEPEPAPKEPAEPPKEPAEPVKAEGDIPPEEPTDWSDEEWDKLSPDEQEAELKKYEEAEAKEAEVQKTELTDREKAVTDGFAKLERDKADWATKRETEKREADDLVRRRTEQLTEAAREHPEVAERFKLVKDVDRATKKDRTGFLTRSYKPEDLVSKDEIAQKRLTPEQVNQLNMVRNAEQIKGLAKIEAALAPVLEPVFQLGDAMQQANHHRDAQLSWAKTAADIGRELGIPVGDPLYDEIGDQLTAEELTPLGSAMSDNAREGTVRRIIDGIRGAPQRPGTQRTKIQFPKRPPDSAFKGRKPPRRPPRTMGSAGGTSDRPPQEAKGGTDAEILQTIATDRAPKRR